MEPGVTRTIPLYLNVTFPSSVRYAFTSLISPILSNRYLCHTTCSSASLSMVIDHLSDVIQFSCSAIFFNPGSFSSCLSWEDLAILVPLVYEACLQLQAMRSGYTQSEQRKSTFLSFFLFWGLKAGETATVGTSSSASLGIHWLRCLHRSWVNVSETWLTLFCRDSLYLLTL